MSNAVFRLTQSGGSFQTGGPVISRVSRVKTATVTIAATDTSQTTVMNSDSSVPVSTKDTPTATASSASSMLSATPTSIATTATATSAAEITPQPTSTDSTPAASQVSVPVTTLIAIIGGTIGGILFLVFCIAVAQAFARRRHIIHQEAESPGRASTTLEKGSTPGGRQQQRVNDGNIGIPQPSSSAHSELNIAQPYQTACVVPDAYVQTWPAAHDLHPKQIIAELPAASHAGHSQHDHRG
ncbi:uncharacterized protein GLRG_07105 [Colletotrichum graminicola M1.001]|uniref:Uncharacterized protein n=1 Tax=Colletotrichum graminicola (strain M1.001 / M2 / FGSC 10212) TaxID=645133 RepID=E3QM73_COLGM|nr:uncharacterized protein GLRG_07105 [Colletotrichum graminicola M1.001]EFQ31961.1 hypothetical protein GLRG_07105 [Colletotrichum graminicola M1.001]